MFAGQVGQVGRVGLAGQVGRIGQFVNCRRVFTGLKSLNGLNKIPGGSL